MSTELDSVAISQRLRTLREEKGLTQQELADMCGLKNRASVNHFEKGQVPTVHVLLKMSEIFGKSLNELLYGTDERPLLPGTGNEPALALYREFVGLERVDQQLILKEMELFGSDNRAAKGDMRHSVNLVLKVHGFA